VVIEDLPELPIELDGHALAQFSGADHVVAELLGAPILPATMR
jgi:hypothetical protein